MLRALTTPIFPHGIRGNGLSFVFAALAVATADALFYDRVVGISAVIFIALLAVSVAILSPRPPSREMQLAALGILSASVMPMVESFSFLSLVSGLAGLSATTLMMTGQFHGDVLDRLYRMAWQLASGPAQFWSVMTRSRRLERRTDGSTFVRRAMMSWIAPVSLGVVFVALFAAANPLIEKLLAAIEFGDSAKSVDFGRVLFWLVFLGLTWSFVHIRLCPNVRWSTDLITKFSECATSPDAESLFGTTAALRSLLLFNALFAVQSCLDIAYLWGGVRLPDGMSYAAYAHRGAYPLIATALLAALFVLVIMRPGSRNENTPLIRSLVYLWVGQNVLLVASSILRLDLYVAAYSLTCLRVAAFIWMFLVVTGLLLIVARIALRQSNQWLVSMNVIALGLVLHGCGFVDFRNLIAAYNIEQSREVSGYGAPLDIEYLCSLGPYAVPAIDALLTTDNASRIQNRSRLETCAAGNARRHRARMDDWRAWSYRGWRLMRHIEERRGVKHPHTPDVPRWSQWQIQQ